jgi:hypothetical protein
MEDRKVVCVNFFAGPGAGKSTLAMRVASDLKDAGVRDCELITEYAKNKVWEQNWNALKDQLYITAKQRYHMMSVAQHVDIIVTDSPLILGCIYGKDDLLSPLIHREFQKFHNINIFLDRVKKYNPVGRMQTEAEASTLDTEVKAMLESNSYAYDVLPGSTRSSKAVLDIVFAKAPWLRRACDD